ncbi:hypothetical protein, partial [Salmonella enterica]|uniref:hypothetical protein n=1 Tax=Salmonella enterica TaxID=28901 RepID=UPI001C5752D8|nr:hypothetical protein [Salmonella enterica subsp. enterica serovar Javiana]
MAASVPRASGDKPLIARITAIYRIVFPAPAGINREDATIGFAPGGVPRASGDKPGGNIHHS